jgi:hypothetical protein
VSVDFKLGIAAIAETLTVQGSIPLVETSRALMSSTIRQTEVAELPMINRSLAAMMTLLPGAREVAAAGSHGYAAGYVSFAGNTGRSYNMYVDGVDNKEDQDGGTLVQLSLDGIEEFRALGAGFQAEYGRGSTVVVLASKSGTNLLRGSGFLFGRNESLTATDYFSKPARKGQRSESRFLMLNATLDVDNPEAGRSRDSQLAIVGRYEGCAHRDVRGCHVKQIQAAREQRRSVCA